MDWLNRMNGAIDYIESNLCEVISYDEAAQIACCSTYHFQRMFSFITDIPLSEYIRRRRLTLAAFDIQTSNIKVIEVALKYGYKSPESFARAFKKLHGVMPKSVRQSGIVLKAYPKMTFSLSIKGDEEMNYRIEQRESFEVFGVYGVINESDEAFVEVPEFCRKCDEDGTVDDMNELLGRSHDSMLHAALYDYQDTTFKYMICYEVPKGVKIPDKYSRLFIPTSTWAIFSGPISELAGNWKRIYTEWFPTSEYEEVDAPKFEMYYGLAQNATGEIWIPIRKK